MRTPFRLSTLLGGLGLWLSLSGSVFGEPKHIDLEQALEKGRNEFVSKSADSDKKLRLAIEQRLSFARKAGDKAGLEKIQSELNQYEQYGTPPASLEKAIELYDKQMAAARTKVEKLYRSQIKEYVKRFEDSKAKALETDLKQFQAIEGGNSGEELLRFGGCDDELTFSKSSSWVMVQGTWQRRTESPKPHAGSGLFWPSYDEQAELAQDIDVKKFAKRIDDQQLRAVFQGSVRTLPQTTQDTSRILIEFLDASRKQLDAFDSGEIGNPEQWQSVQDSRIPPKGTRFIRIRLVSKRVEGVENNGYYDSLSLMLSRAGSRDRDTREKSAK